MSIKQFDSQPFLVSRTPGLISMEAHLIAVLIYLFLVLWDPNLHFEILSVNLTLETRKGPFGGLGGNLDQKSRITALHSPKSCDCVL